MIGSDAHLLQELPLLIEPACRGKLDLSDVVTDMVLLAADAANEALDGVERFGGDLRTVIPP